MVTPGISSVGRAIRRRHWLIWGSAIAGVLVALAAALVRPPTYEATTLLSIDAARDANQGFDVAMQADQFLTQRFMSMATSRPVLDRVCARQGAGCDPTTLSRQIRVGTPRATAQLEVAATASTPDAAVRLANDVAEELVARNRTLADQQAASQRTLLQDQLGQANDQVQRALQQVQANEAAGRSDAAALSQLSLAQTQYSAAYQRLQDLDVQRSQLAGVISIVQPAVRPRLPVDPDPLRYALVGAGLGLVAGLLAALLAERSRGRIRTGAELAEAAGCGVVIELGGWPAVDAPGPYRYLARLVRHANGDCPRSLLVIASSVHDPVNEVGLALARAMAEGRERSLVVLAPAGDGAVSERREVLVDGPGSASSASATGSAQLQPSRRELDLAIRCSLPPMQDPGEAWLETSPQQAVAVATRGEARYGDLRRSVDLLRQVGIQVVAAVLVPRGWPAAPDR
jgi:capsular polysaccharide biosynthesis protein